MTRGLGVVLRVLLLGCALALLPVTPAQAHVEVELISPAPDSQLPRSPSAFELHFSEPLRPQDVTGRIARTSGAGPSELTPDAGSELVSRTITLPLTSELPRGSYTLTVTARGLDGHTVIDKFYFAIGDAPLQREGVETSASSAPVHVKLIAKIADLTEDLGLVALAGTGPLLVFFPALMRSRRARRLILLGVAACATGTVLSLVVYGPLAENQGLTAAWPESLTATVSTQTGRLQGLRLIALACFAAAFARRRRGPSPAAENTLVLAALVVLLTFAGSTHAAGAKLAMAAMGVAMLHLAAASWWVATLLTTLIAARTPGYRHSQEFDDGLESVGRTTPTVIATALLTGLGVTGFVTEGFDRDGLWSLYGVALAIKLTAVVIGLLLGRRVRSAIIAHARPRVLAREVPAQHQVTVLTRSRPQLTTGFPLVIALTLEVFVLAVVLLCASALSAWVSP